MYKLVKLYEYVSVSMSRRRDVTSVRRPWLTQCVTADSQICFIQWRTLSDKIHDHIARISAIFLLLHASSGPPEANLVHSSPTHTLHLHLAMSNRQSFGPDPRRSRDSLACLLLETDTAIDLCSWRGPWIRSSPKHKGKLLVSYQSRRRLRGDRRG